MHFISVNSHVIAAAFGIVLDPSYISSDRQDSFALFYWAYTVDVMYAMIAFAVYVFSKKHIQHSLTASIKLKFTDIFLSFRDFIYLFIN